MPKNVFSLGMSGNSYSSEKILVSIVCHQSINDTQRLLDDLSRLASSDLLEIILTINLGDDVPTVPSNLSVVIKRNVLPVSFAKNHNNALLGKTHNHFLVLNPDLRVPEDPIPQMLNIIRKNGIGIVGPVLLNTDKSIQTEIRKFPSILNIWSRPFRRLTAKHLSGKDLNGQSYRTADFIPGCFMLIRGGLFNKLGGFSERYQHYLEDVDICFRASRVGELAAITSAGEIIHHGAFKSRAQIGYFIIHLQSLFKFFLLRLALFLKN